VEEDHVPQSTLRRATPRGLLAVAAGLLIGASMPLAVGAAPQAGFKTLQPAMMVAGPGAPLGTEIKPLITVGDTIGDYMFEAIPDGIAFYKSGKNEATVLVNHETSTVPFPFSQGTSNPISPTISNSLNDFRNSELSELVIRKGGNILSAEMVIDSGAGYHRFCSNFLATSDGFEDRPLLFANEEGIDWVSEEVFDDGDAEGIAWTSGLLFEGSVGARQIGAVIAYDPETGAHKPIWGMGRHNHENTVAIPGFGYPVLLSGDDSFNQNAPQSQLYAYIAEDADAVWDDEGELWAFAPDEEFETINTYYDFTPGSTMSISGHFVQVPKDIAMGKLGADAEARDVLSTDYPGFLLPPSNGQWQRAPGITSGPGVDGPQWVLEHWGDPVDEGAGDYGNNVFQFLRIEDIAYDKRPGMENVVYLVDSGRGQNLTPAPGVSTNGRVWKMVLDPEDPTVVQELSILIEGDNLPVKDPDAIHQPDNIESTLNGLLITEDPGSQQQFPVGSTDPNATTARLMYYSFEGESLSAVLKIDQSADEGPTDVDLPIGGTPSAWGTWESSGIIDVSSVFGPGKFMITVQAHTLFVDIDTTSAPSNLGGVNDPENDDPDWQFKREGGQLLLVTLPGL
jgi:hypothetical protein